MTTNSVVLTIENYSQHTNKLKHIRERSHIVVFKFISIRVLTSTLNINQIILNYFTDIMKFYYLGHFTYY